jgi:hypothetical protein
LSVSKISPATSTAALASGAVNLVVATTTTTAAAVPLQRPGNAGGNTCSAISAVSRSYRTCLACAARATATATGGTCARATAETLP